MSDSNEKRPRFQDQDNLFSRMERYGMQTKPATDNNRPRQTTPVSGPSVPKTSRPLKPLPTSKTAAVQTEPRAPGSLADSAKQLTEVRRHLLNIKDQLRQLTSPTRTQWTLLSTSVELLAARQEIMMSDLNAIRDKLDPREDNNNDENGDTDSDDDIWSPVTPAEENPCYEGAALCQCRHNKEL